MATTHWDTVDALNTVSSNPSQTASTHKTTDPTIIDMPSTTYAGRVAHRDALGRLEQLDPIDVHERFIRPSDARIDTLKIQRSNGAVGRAQSASGATWDNSGTLRNPTPKVVELVEWLYSSPAKTGMWVPVCLALIFMLAIPASLQGKIHDGGFYDPVRYRDWGYAKAARNPAEDRRGKQIQTKGDEQEEDTPLLSPPGAANGGMEMSEIPSRSAYGKPTGVQERGMDDRYDDLPARHTGPRSLCFINGNGQVETRAASDWVAEHNEDAAAIEYIFLSYTRRQFETSSAEDIEASKLSPSLKSRKRQLAEIDRRTLLEYGTRAALAAGKHAFWIDFKCVTSPDIYRISDIVRASSSVVIVTGPSLDDYDHLEHKNQPLNEATWIARLQEWATRIWTLPEVLLAPIVHPITIYSLGFGPTPRNLAKRNFAIAFNDAKAVRQLIDHYESSIHLTPLELVSIALECLSGRQTRQFVPGDVSYALMGLLRRRPDVDPSDSGFEAFARLSLANDSDLLLERLICMLPPDRDAEWHDIRDAWGARLWDVEPTCQIAGIVDKETVTVDGAFAAHIRWEKLDAVAFIKRETGLRTFAKLVLRGLPAWFLMGLIILIAGGVVNHELNKEAQDYDDPGYSSSGEAAPLLAIGAILFVFAFILAMFAPAMIINLYRGTFRSTQASFYGIEGKVDIRMMERYLFGMDDKRLRWSTNGSRQSAHTSDAYGQCEATEPIEDYPFRNSQRKQHNERLFTLVDSYSMTATLFYAERPPTAILVCGREGGMQRALLCSYDWRTQTFCRETVLRMKTIILERMSRIDRFRFALKRPE